MHATPTLAMLISLGSTTTLMAADPVVVAGRSATLDYVPTISASASPNPFVRGSTLLTFTGSYVGDVQSRTRENLYVNAVGVAWYPIDNLGLVAEIPVSGVQQDGPDAVATGLDLFARYHFYSFEKLTVYLDGGAGFLLSSRSIPAGGTSFNFVERGGIGLTYQIAPHWFLDAGSRLEHLSNAGLRGSEHNPSMNLGVEGYVGIMYAF